MDNIDMGTKLLECSILLRTLDNPRPKYINKYKQLENRLIVKKEDSQSLYNEIESFHRELGL